MADIWVHCNLCTRQPTATAPDITFQLTACGHIVCAVCTLDKQSGASVCPVCQQAQVAFVEINSALKPDVRRFFSDPKALLDKWKKEFGQIIDFQTGHRKRLNKSIMEQQKNMRKMAKQCQQHMQKQAESIKYSPSRVQSGQEEKRRLQSEVAQLKVQQQQLIKAQQQQQMSASAGRHKNPTVLEQFGLMPSPSGPPPGQRRFNPQLAATGFGQQMAGISPTNPLQAIQMTFGQQIEAHQQQCHQNLASRLSAALAGGGIVNSNSSFLTPTMADLPQSSPITTSKMLGLAGSGGGRRGSANRAVVNPYQHRWKHPMTVDGLLAGSSVQRAAGTPNNPHNVKTFR